MVTCGGGNRREESPKQKEDKKKDEKVGGVGDMNFFLLRGLFMANITQYTQVAQAARSVFGRGYKHTLGAKERVPGK